MNMCRRMEAEFFGTFWLVLGGCGTAIFAGHQVGFVGVALAFGLSVLTMAYAVGHVSGGHFNPAVTLGLWSAGRFPVREVVPYMLAQVGGALAASTTLYYILKTSGKPIATFACNGYGQLSPERYSMISAFIAETVLTFFFLMVIIGVTSVRSNKLVAPIAIGLCLTLIHLISIPITNTSVNPARSISQAIFVRGEYLNQLWLFIVAPFIGAILAGIVSKAFTAEDDYELDESEKESVF